MDEPPRGHAPRRSACSACRIQAVHRQLRMQGTNKKRTTTGTTTGGTTNQFRIDINADVDVPRADVGSTVFTCEQTGVRAVEMAWQTLKPRLRQALWSPHRRVPQFQCVSIASRPSPRNCRDTGPRRCTRMLESRLHPFHVCPYVVRDTRASDGQCRYPPHWSPAVTSAVLRRL